MNRRGLTLIELVIVIAIIGVLVTLSFPAYRWIKAKLSFATCVGNLKSLHAGMNVYLQDHDLVWPQMPEEAAKQGVEPTAEGGDDGDEDEEETHWEWWYNILKPYGVPKKTWVCPADRDGMELVEDPQARFVGSYVPSMFDSMRSTAYRYSNQPWFIERGENHGKQGPNMIMPNSDVVQGMQITPDKPE